jgi:hypothetical protein
MYMCIILRRQFKQLTAELHYYSSSGYWATKKQMMIVVENIGEVAVIARLEESLRVVGTQPNL